jgi:peptidoglycan/xylan/chitin deacetylase (PgdA/CDA1 family)
MKNEQGSTFAKYQHIILGLIIILFGTFFYILLIHNSHSKVNINSGSTNITNTDKHKKQEPEITKITRPSVNCKVEKCIALTFDDGPAPDSLNKQLIGYLNKYNANATFFVIGQSANEEKNSLRRIAKNGFTIGSHSYNHPDLTRVSTKELKYQLNRTDKIIENITGEVPPFLRPPYGSYNKRVIKYANRPVILWDIDTLDWQSRNSKKVYQSVIRSAHAGAVILMHEIYPSTVNAIPKILSTLKNLGYSFSSIPELYNNKKLKAGRVYFGK